MILIRSVIGVLHYTRSVSEGVTSSFGWGWLARSFRGLSRPWGGGGYRVPQAGSTESVCKLAPGGCWPLLCNITPSKTQFLMTHCRACCVCIRALYLPLALPWSRHRVLDTLRRFGRVWHVGGTVDSLVPGTSHVVCAHHELRSLLKTERRTVFHCCSCTRYARFQRTPLHHGLLVGRG